MIEKTKVVSCVPADEFKTFDRGAHFDAAGQIEPGERFAAGKASGGR